MDLPLKPTPKEDWQRWLSMQMVQVKKDIEELEKAVAGRSKLLTMKRHILAESEKALKES